MKYWLMTWDPPYERDDDDGWGLYEVIEWDEEVGDEDLVKVVRCIFGNEGETVPDGDIEGYYDDSLTEDPKRVIPFLFDQEF